MSIPALAQAVSPPPALKKVAVPRPTNLATFVRDENAAVALGKAFFWDMQTGSDGIQACASCHFHAGADSRAKNQLNPGTAHGATTFDVAGPNAVLQASDFPFHRVANPDSRTSAVLADFDDVVSSQGVTRADFDDIVPGQATDRCTPVPDPVWHVGATNIRMVQGRNAPTVINAAFSFRNFWDGRANAVFNGVDPFGPRNPNARAIAVGPDGNAAPVSVGLLFGSLASQAVAPPLGSTEMSCTGRTFPKLGKKLLSLTPLGKQVVDRTDSVLGGLARSATVPGARGLQTSYAQLIQQAFLPRWWDSNAVVTFTAGMPTVWAPTGAPLTTDQFTVMEANFSLFWGLAIELYESRLISDDTPFDRFVSGDTSALTAEQQVGLDVFLNTGSCAACHVSSTFSAASVNNLGQETPIQLMSMAQGTAFYDGGFYNIGVTPTAADVGVGGEAPAGVPLSFARRQQLGLDAPETVGIQVLPVITAGDRVAANGGFKTPGLRNVELTAPYMHNGGMLTLDQVVAFYTRGGDFHAANVNDLDPKVDTITALVGQPATKAALVAFLKGLTDERVRFERAPFDHPQLFVPNGPLGDESHVIDDGTGQARDGMAEIPAVGAAGAMVGIDGTLGPHCGDNRVNQAAEQCDGTADAACPGSCGEDCTCGWATVAGVVEADVSVLSSSPKTNAGKNTPLVVDASPATQTFLRVRVSGAAGRPVRSAALRLTVGSKSGADSKSGGRIRSVTSCAWDELTLTWKSQPAIDGPVLGAPLGAVARNAVVTFDLTAAIPGDGVYCFAIDSTSTDDVQYDSREASTGKPQLVVTVQAPPVVPICGNGVLQVGEQCDGIADAACPGFCQPDCRCGIPTTDISDLGAIIAAVPHPSGGGNKDLEVIRDGDLPPIGNLESARQYDSWDGENAATEDWIGYDYEAASHTFTGVLFQEGKHFVDGGWFQTLTVQVRHAGVWVPVSSLLVTPSYPGIDDGVSYETYQLDFAPITGDAIRLYGAPGGSAAFITVGELRVFGSP